MIAIRKFKAEEVIDTRLSVVGYNTYKGKDAFAVNVCRSFNSSRDLINHRVAGDACAFYLNSIATMILKGQVTPEVIVFQSS